MGCTYTSVWLCDTFINSRLFIGVGYSSRLGFRVFQGPYHNSFWKILYTGLDWTESGVFNSVFSILRFQAFFFSCAWTVKSYDFTVQEKNTVHILLMYCLRIVHGFHDTIHTFKNYFIKVFTVFSFNNNKFNPKILQYFLVVTCCY